MTAYKLKKVSPALVAQLSNVSVPNNAGVKTKYGEGLNMAVSYKLVNDATDGFTKPLEEIDESIRNIVAEADSLAYEILERNGFFANSRQATELPPSPVPAPKPAPATPAPVVEAPQTPSGDDDEEEDAIALIKDKIQQLEDTKALFDEGEDDVVIAAINDKIAVLNKTLEILTEF